MAELTHLQPGMPILYGGNRVTTVPESLAEAFQSGDRLLVVQLTGELLHVPQSEWERAENAVESARSAFHALNRVDDDAITAFYDGFASALEDDAIWTRISAANEADVQRAKSRGRSTTRLTANEKMRRDMIGGLRAWRDTLPLRGQVTETVEHDGWSVDLVKSGYGVVGFVFEGRPNVFADATGVLRSGNTTVMRIGSDALGTAQAIMEHALRPKLNAAGLPEGAVTLLESPAHSAGWALFSLPKLGLAVARGSGRSVALLGSLASQAGIPVSLHGTGGAWIVADETADPKKLYAAVYHSTDRKVCNTLNTLCIPRSRAEELIPVVLKALHDRGETLGHGYKLHVSEDSRDLVPDELYSNKAAILRAEGPVEESVAEIIGEVGLGREWEWEGTPEITLKAVRDVDEAVELFNRYSPHFVASLISEDVEAHESFFRAVDAPFVGNGFTRWVDGQYSLKRPELGLSNWEYGRLFGRSGILSGDSVYTVRLRMDQTDPDVHR